MTSNHSPAYQREYRQKNHEKVLARERAYREARRQELREYQREWYWRDPEKHRQQTSEWRANNPELARDKARTWQASNRDKVKSSRLKMRYGLSLAEFDRCLEYQGGDCLICGGTRKLSVDHDHATGLPRGILCDDCNNAIARMGDDPERLRAAADYLERARKSTPSN